MKETNTLIGIIDSKKFSKEELDSMKKYHNRFAVDVDLSDQPESVCTLLCQIEEILEEHDMLY
jgi:hypothetical protein